MKLPLFAVALVATFSSVAASAADPCQELLDVCTASESNNCATDHICEYKGNGPSAQRGWRCREPPNNMNNIDLGVDYYEGTCSDIEFNANGEEICQATWQGNKYVPTTTCSNPNEECLIEVDADTNGFVGTGVCKATECVGGGQGQNAQEKGAGTYRVTICHRTCSKTNPWVRITVDEDSWFGQGCGHSREHNVTEDCNHNEAERIEHWGSPDPVDYLLKAHGYKKLLNQWNQTDHDYWADWEPACPYVRSTKLNGQPCCDWAKGNCCGPRPDELVDDFPPVCGNGMIEGYGEGMEECEPELATPEGATMECSDDCKIPVCGNGVVDAPYEECDSGVPMGTDTCSADCKTISCGDGVVEGNEECDEGAAMPSATCVNCQTIECGNGVVEGNEECDEGAAMPSATCVNCQTVTTQPTVPESGTTTTTNAPPTVPPDYECPGGTGEKMYELISVNGNPVTDSSEYLGTTFESIYHTDIIENVGAPNVVSLKFCNNVDPPQTLSEVWIEYKAYIGNGGYNQECIQVDDLPALPHASADACPDISSVHCMQSEPVTVINVYTTDGPGEKLDILPNCCYNGNPLVTEYTFVVRCECPESIA